MPEDFRREDVAFKSLAVRVAEGSIFISLDDQPLGFGKAAHALRQSAGVYGWGRAKVAHQELYGIRAN